MEPVQDVLAAMRRIIRAVDLDSKRLYKECGLTTPQLLLLLAIEKNPKQTLRELSEEISLSQGTVTIILDKLQAKNLVQRQRSETDKRKVHVVITEQGRTLLAASPSPLQAEFLSRFTNLQQWEQTQILASLQRLASLMGAKELDAAPVLNVGAMAEPSQLQQGDK